LTDGDELFSLTKELATTSEPSRQSFTESFSSLATDPAALVLVAVDEPSDRLLGYLLGFATTPSLQMGQSVGSKRSTPSPTDAEPESQEALMFAI
jgi:hypothetical protein